MFSNRHDGEEWNVLSILDEKILYPKYEILNKVCRELNIYPNAKYPGMCWILEEVLDIDPSIVRQDGVHLATGYYETYCYTREGTRKYGPDGYARTEANMLSKTQMSALEPWWDYIPEELL